MILNGCFMIFQTPGYPFTFPPLQMSDPTKTLRASDLTNGLWMTFDDHWHVRRRVASGLGEGVIWRILRPLLWASQNTQGGVDEPRDMEVLEGPLVLCETSPSTEFWLGGFPHPKFSRGKTRLDCRECKCSFGMEGAKKKWERRRREIHLPILISQIRLFFGLISKVTLQLLDVWENIWLSHCLPKMVPQGHTQRTSKTLPQELPKGWNKENL